MINKILDVSDKFSCLVAEMKGLNVLILRKLDKIVKCFDGTNAIYELEYLWLSKPDIFCVKGQDYIYVTKKEYNPNKGLFEQFNLF